MTSNKLNVDSRQAGRTDGDACVPPQVAGLFAALEGGGVRYCIWKSVKKLDAALSGNDDIDVLVDRRDLAQATALLSDHGFFEVKKPWHQEDIGTASYYRLLAQGAVVHFHLHTAVLFGNSERRTYRLPIEDDLLRTRVWNLELELWVADPDVDIALFLTRHLVRGKFGLPDRFIAEFERLRTSYPDRTDRVPEWFPVPIVRSLIEQNGTICVNVLLRNRVKRELRFYRRTPRPLRSPFALIALGLRKVRRQLSASGNTDTRIGLGGLLIPFVGIDGAGKSSLIERTNDTLSKSMPVRTISLGSGQSGASLIRRLIFKLLGSKARFGGHSTARAEVRTARTDVVYPWYYKVWLHLCIRDKHRELRSGLASAAEGMIVLADRWPQQSDPAGLDAPRTRSMRVASRYDKYLAGLEARVFEAAERVRVPLVILLDVSPEVSVLRKPEDLALAQARDARLRLHAMRWNADRVATIDADASIDEVDELVRQAISETLASTKSKPQGA